MTDGKDSAKDNAKDNSSIVRLDPVQNGLSSGGGVRVWADVLHIDILFGNCNSFMISPCPSCISPFHALY